MKKILRVFIILCLTVFSFYYTNKIVSLSKVNDPLMREITKEAKVKEVTPVNGVINGNTIILGKSGKVVDINSSYEKMKKLDSYSEAFLEYTKIEPKITKNENYDKIITGISTKNNEISFIFKTNSLDEIEEISYILNKNNVSGTFFIDGHILETNMLRAKDLFKDRIYLGLYSYNGYFNSTSTSYMKKFIKSFNHSNYCLYKDEKFLDQCKNLRINTIKGKLVEKDIYNYFKTKKESGIIYEISINKSNIRSLNSTIIYLKQKGYQIKSLNDLLSE